jgi:hypothetical protein
MLFYPAALPLSGQTLSYTAGLIRRHRRQIGSAWRKLNPGQQALLVLACLRKGETFADLAAGFGVGTGTARRYVTETVGLLAARSKPSQTGLLQHIPWLLYTSSSLLRSPATADLQRARHSPGLRQVVDHLSTGTVRQNILVVRYLPLENIRDKTFSEHLQQVRTGNQPNAYAAVRNLVTGAFRHAGHVNIAHARRWHGRDDQRILALYGNG